MSKHFASKAYAGAVTLVNVRQEDVMELSGIPAFESAKKVFVKPGISSGIDLSDQGQHASPLGSRGTAETTMGPIRRVTTRTWVQAARTSPTSSTRFQRAPRASKNRVWEVEPVHGGPKVCPRGLILTTADAVAELVPFQMDRVSNAMRCMLGGMTGSSKSCGLALR